MPTPPPPKSKGVSLVKPPASKSELGKKLLRRILEEDLVITLLELTPEILLPDELKAYKWIREYHRKFKQLPSVEVTASNGHPLPEADSPPDYYVARIRDRGIFNALNSRQTEYAEAMAAQDMDKAVQVVRNMLSAVTALKNPGSYTPISHIAKQVLEKYALVKATPGLMGVTSGYPSLDYQTTGLCPGDLVVIVARPNMGKSYVLLKMAHSAWKAGKKVAIITMEMVNEALVRRWVGVDAGLNPDLIRRGELCIHGEQILTHTVNSYDKQDNAYFMAGNFQKSVNAVEEMIIQLDPDVIFIDASYLLSPSEKNGHESGTQLAKQVVDELKALAQRYGKPIVITVQFNRNVRKNAKATGTGGSRFDLADIGGTDAVGQNADIVLGLRLPPMPYRDTHRIVEVMKIREGVAQDFATRFSFWPMDFDEVPLESIMEISADDDEEDEQVSNKPSWMLK